MQTIQYNNILCMRVDVQLTLVITDLVDDLAYSPVKYNADLTSINVSCDDNISSMSFAVSPSVTLTKSINLSKVSSVVSY